MLSLLTGVPFMLSVVPRHRLACHGVCRVQALLPDKLLNADPDYKVEIFRRVRRR